MSKSQRNKGAAYEREVVARFNAHLDQTVSRRIGQARDGENDINVGPLTVECKRRKSFETLYKWLDQATAATTARRERNPSDPAGFTPIPAIVSRADLRESLITFRLNDFLDLFGEELNEVCASWTNCGGRD